ncbi:unnamed protein product [Triticum turgidum subsp. durum]|uniref:DYW domain-containing protein n=1 Tax=Triticum turgidum subsp. durum TaxID=4567 RepID=A0A9R1R0B7_TRITD|nr:unnamed protein product [Triticum turgidum subsp. durum]
MSGVLPACARSEGLAGKEAMHGYVVKRGMAGNRFVQNALMDMYARLGEMDVARRIFAMIDPRDIVSWNTLITGCVVQGHVAEAFQLVTEMQLPSSSSSTEDERCMPNNITLMTLLPGCAALAAPARGKEIHGYAVRHALESDIAVGSALVDMYAKCGLRRQGVAKEPGCSWIEVDGAIHRFMAGESSHPASAEVHAHMDALWERMRREGYAPDTSCVLHDVGEAEKAGMLRYHSEKLAIAFGLLRAPAGAAIRVAKNLRVCNDCHEAAKFMSKMVGREIVLRDVRRFHHFRDGSCSCGDYW